MCNKKERKRDRRWYLFPVSTLGAVYFAVHGGTGRFVFFSEAGRGGCFFFPRRDGAFLKKNLNAPRPSEHPPVRGKKCQNVVFFSEAGRGGCCFFPRREWVAFFFFSTGRDGALFFFFFEGRDGTAVFGGGNFFGGTGQNRYTVPPAVHVKPWKIENCKHQFSWKISVARVIGDGM